MDGLDLSPQVVVSAKARMVAIPVHSPLFLNTSDGGRSVCSLVGHRVKRKSNTNIPSSCSPNDPSPREPRLWVLLDV